jgi:hypothetical protein
MVAEVLVAGEGLVDEDGAAVLEEGFHYRR